MPANKKQSELPLDTSASPGEQGTANGEAPRPDPEATQNDLSFEDAVERLGQIVERLESEGLPLEDSLKLFEEGVRLARKSQARLESAERRVQALLTFDETGNPIVEELDPE